MGWSSSSSSRVRGLLRPIVVGALATLVGGGISHRLLVSLNDPVPALLGALATHADPEPTAGTMPTKPTSRVVVVVLDGVGERAILPLAERGALGPLAAIIPIDTGLPSLSRPGYHVSLTGVSPQVSGIRANFYTPARADSVADRVHAAGGTVAFVQESVPWYGELFAKPGDFVSAAPWAGGVEAFARASDSGAALIVVHLTGADNAGHGSGAGSEAYRWTVDRQIDAIGDLVKHVEASSRASETRWLIGADHGHTQAGGHGGPEPDVTRTSWFLLAAGRDRGQPLHRVPNRRPATTIAPLISQLLGVDPPRQALAEPPPLPASLAPPVPVPRMLLPRSFAVQEAAAAHERAIARRGTLTAGLSLLALATAIARLSWRLLAASLAPTLAACAAFAFAGPGFTLSAIHSERSYLQACVSLLALGSAFAWTFVRERGATLESALVVSVLPATVAFALTAGSLGTCTLDPVAVLLLSSTGLLPPGVAIGLGATELGVSIARRLRGRAPRASSGQNA